MSISPSSDIVLGVANAADPQKVRAAVEQLTRGSGEGVTAIPAAPESVSGTAKALPARSATSSMPVSAHGRAPGFAPRAEKQAAEPYQEFEAFFLQTFVEAMLPKEAQSLFGRDPAGNIWKSMMAEHMARELARSTAFGIAEQIADSRKNNGNAPASVVQPSDAASAPAGSDGYLSDLQKLLATGEPQVKGV